MIPYGHQTTDEKDVNAVAKVLRSAWLTQGPAVTAFEKALAQYCGVKYAVAASSGTAALHLAYLAAGLKVGDEVITTPNTFVATANMILAVGAKPVFSDIRADTNNLDSSLLEKILTKKTRAIVPVDFAGHPCEMVEINAFAKRHNLLVIEDASHALGASYRGRKVGSMSDLTIFSFHPVKPITTAEGGAVLTNNRILYQRMLSLRSHGIHKDKAGKNVMTELGYNYRLSDVQAALGLSQLPKLDRFNRQRHQIVKWYTQELKNVRKLILPVELPGVYSSWHLYVIRTAKHTDRDRLANFLKKSGIGVNFHYPAVYGHPYYRKHGYSKMKLPQQELFQKSALTLPCFPALSQKQVRFICGKIKEFFKNSRI